MQIAQRSQVHNALQAPIRSRIQQCRSVKHPQECSYLEPPAGRLVTMRLRCHPGTPTLFKLTQVSCILSLNPAGRELLVHRRSATRLAKRSAGVQCCAEERPSPMLRQQSQARLPPQAAAVAASTGGCMAHAVCAAAAAAAAEIAGVAAGCMNTAVVEAPQRPAARTQQQRQMSGVGMCGSSENWRVAGPTLTACSRQDSAVFETLDGMQCCRLQCNRMQLLALWVDASHHETAVEQAESMYACDQYSLTVVTYSAACIRPRYGTNSRARLGPRDATMAAQPHVLAPGRTKPLQDLTYIL
jgi:hypothetical protein